MIAYQFLQGISKAILKPLSDCKGRHKHLKPTARLKNKYGNYENDIWGFLLKHYIKLPLQQQRPLQSMKQRRKRPFETRI